MSAQQDEVIWRSAATEPTEAAVAAPPREDQARQSRPRPDWIAPVLLLIFDAVAWIATYSLIGWIRGDQFFNTPFQLFLIELLQLGVIVQTLFIIGGYDRQIDMRNLIYTAEHILALLGAALVSSFLLYSAATFEQSMPPSRGVLLLSFLLFLPVSLLYRRWISVYSARTSAAKA